MTLVLFQQLHVLVRASVGFTHEFLVIEFVERFVIIGIVGRRFVEFFTANIRNRNTRLAYARACYQFFHWARENVLTLDTVRPFHVAAYIEQMPGSKPTIKQKLAAIRMLYDFLVIRQLVPVNPTASVRGPKYVVKRGKTGSAHETDPRVR